MITKRIPSANSKSRRIVRINSLNASGRNYYQALKTLAQRVLESEGWGYHIDIIIADDAELRRLHRTFFSDDSITDVITFPGDEEEGRPSEIYLNFQEARRQAAEDGESLHRALSRLLIHGILHLGGWRDRTSMQRRRMLEYGDRLLAELADSGR